MVPDIKPCGTPVVSSDTGLNPLDFHKSYSSALPAPLKTLSFLRSSGWSTGAFENNCTQPESPQKSTTYPLASRRASSCGRNFSPT